MACITAVTGAVRSRQSSGCRVTVCHRAVDSQSTSLSIAPLFYCCQSRHRPTLQRSTAHSAPKKKKKQLLTHQPASCTCFQIILRCKKLYFSPTSRIQILCVCLCVLARPISPPASRQYSNVDFMTLCVKFFEHICSDY